MENILEAQGFEPEMIGGGSYLLSRYLSGGGFVMVSGTDGMGMPELNDWLVVSYPPDFDGDYSTIVFEASSEEQGDIPLYAVVDAAIENLEVIWSEYDTCRNGRPIDECNCC